MAGAALQLNLTKQQAATVLMRMKLKALRQAVAGTSSPENVAMLLSDRLAMAPKTARIMASANMDFERVAQLIQNAR